MGPRHGFGHGRDPLDGRTGVAVHGRAKISSVPGLNIAARAAVSASDYLHNTCHEPCRPNFKGLPTGASKLRRIGRSRALSIHHNAHRAGAAFLNPCGSVQPNAFSPLNYCCSEIGSILGFTQMGGCPKWSARRRRAAHPPRHELATRPAPRPHKSHAALTFPRLRLCQPPSGGRLSESAPSVRLRLGGPGSCTLP